MAEIPDNLGRVRDFKDSNFDSLAEELRAAVGKAVEYATGRAKDNQDDIKKDFDKLVEAMEELGDDIKENLESTRKFVDEVKGAAESMAKRASPAGASSMADAQREQTRILQMILRSHQKAVSEKSAKFTNGGTMLATAPPRRNSLKEMGFRPRGTDKIPAMLSPGEYVVNRRGTAGNEGVLNKINRGYMHGGKVKPEYRAGGGFAERMAEALGGRRHRIEFDEGKAHLVIEGALNDEEIKKVEKTFEEFGQKASYSFRRDFDRGMKESLSKWVTGLAQMFTGHDPFQVLFEGGVKDITMFRREMRELAYETEGITGNFRESQAEFAKIGDNIAGKTGTSVTAFQKAYMSNARKGFKDQKAGMRVLESGLKASTLIGSEAQSTATLFADWHRELNLGAVQMDRMANNMQMVAKRTGVTGDELVGVMKSSEQILKNLRKQGTLTTTAARNIVQSMAEFKKQGFEEEGQRTLSAMSGFGGFTNADEGTKALLAISANRGGVDFQDLMYGDVVQDQSKMGQMGEGLKDFLANSVDIDPSKFDFDMLTKDQRQRLSIILERQGSSLGAAEATLKTFGKIQAGLGGSLAELDKIRKSSTATEKQKVEAEKKMNDQLLSSSMDMLGSVTQVTDKYADKSLAEVSKLLGEDNKYSQDFNTGAKDMATLATSLSSATQNQFGLSGTAEQMEAQIAAMGRDKQVQLRSIMAAEQLDKTMLAQGKGSKDFATRMKDALARGDTTTYKSLAEEMGAAFSESQIDDATGVDPMTKLEQTMSELNETFRKYASSLVGSIFDFIGHTGMLFAQIAALGMSLHHLIDKDLIDGIKNIGLGEKLKSFFGGDFKRARALFAAQNGGKDAFGKALALQIRSSFSSIVGPTFGKILQKSLGPAVLLLGGIKGVMESSEAKRTRTEGFFLGALTGGAKTGSFLSSTLGVKEGSGTDKALGVAGAAAWGASAGAAISLSLGGMDFGASIVVGALIGAFVEIVKIVTEGTDILKDILKPFQVVVDYVYEVFNGIYDILAGIFTLDIGRAFTGLFNIIGSTILVLPRLILGVVQSIVIGLPKLIFRALAMIAEIPGMILGSISRALISLGDNQWVGPIFKTLSAIFEPIYQGLMSIWNPIAALFRGLYRVFDDLGKALFGCSIGGNALGGVMSVLQGVVWGLSYVISWIISPLILLAQALGFVLRMVGAVVSGIVGFFGYLYDVLVGHSIVPDLVFGIIKFFAMLPMKIMGFLLQIPQMIGRTFSNIGSYFQGFEGDGILSTLIRQLGSFFSFIGSTFGNLVGMASGILTVLTGILSLDFGQVWDGLTKIGSSILAQVGNVGTLLWNVLSDGIGFLFNSLKKLPKLFMKLFTAVFVKFPTWLFGLLKDALLALPGILVQGVKFVFLDLPKYLWDGFKSSLSKVWEWIKSWVPKSVQNATAAVTSTAEEQANQRAKEGDSLLHATGGLVGSVYHLLGAVGRAATGDFSTAGSNLQTAGGKALESGKEAASSAWSGLKAVGSYINPFSYFKEGTKKIEKPGLGMLHEGEMVVPRSIVDKIAAMGTGAFGSLSSFVRGKDSGDPGYKTLFSSLRDRISGLGDTFRGCCPGDTDSGAGGLVDEVSAAMSNALESVDDSSFFGQIRNKFATANKQIGKFFKPMTTGFQRARKKGDGFFESITKGFKAQYMSLNKGGFGEKLSLGMDWLGESIFGKKEGGETKKGILQRIKDGIFGSKEGEDTKKGILEMIKDGLFGSGDDVKKGLIQIAKEGLFGKEGEGGGILGWIKGKVFGQKMGEDEMGPPKPGLVDAAKNTATSLWESIKEKVQGDAEEGLFGKAKGLASSMYGKAKERLFGQKMGGSEMGPPKPSLLDRAKAKASGLYGQAKEKAAGLYGSAKEKIFGKDTADRLKEVGEADKNTKGDFVSFKDKMKNIAEGVKQFADLKVLGGAMNLLPTSIGLAAMIPGSLGARMIAAVDGEKLNKSLKGMADGVSQMGKAKVLAGAGAMLVVGLASVALLPALPALMLIGAAGPMIGTGFKALGKGLSVFGKAAANPYTWLGVLLLGALNVAMIPLAYAISLLSPAIEAFGKAIKYAFEGAGSMLRAVGESIGLILKEITMSKALALGVAAIGITALGVAMAAFAAGSFIASWIGYFAGDGVFNKLMQFAEMSTDLMMAATAVNMLSDAMAKFAANKGGGWWDWMTGSDGVIEGFKKLTEIGTPEFHATADSMSKMADGLEKMQSINSVPTAISVSGDSTTATSAPTDAESGVARVEPVHLRDIGGTILRDRAGSGGNKMQSDELSRIEEVSYRQLSELEQMRQGIQDLVSLMKPKGSSIVGSGEDAGPGKTKDPRRPMHAVRFGKMKYGKIGGNANRSFVNNGES